MSEECTCEKKKSLRAGSKQAVLLNMLREGPKTPEEIISRLWGIPEGSGREYVLSLRNRIHQLLYQLRRRGINVQSNIDETRRTWLTNSYFVADGIPAEAE